MADDFIAKNDYDYKFFTRDDTIIVQRKKIINIVYYMNFYK